MAKLKDKVQNALDEGRMLVLGAQIVLGLQFRSVLEPGFDKLPLITQALKMFGLGAMLLAVGLLIAPSAYHRIVERGEDSEETHRYASRMMTWALLPFALGLGVDAFMAAEKILGRKWGVAGGVLALVVSVFFWYMLEFHMRRERLHEITEAKMESKREEAEEEEKNGGKASKVTDKIRHVLTEARTVLPGAQALLGFQLIAILMESFDRLPDASKYVHLASLAMIALTVVLLMTPAAYHRIVEQGEETEHFHRFASKMVVAALVPLALGIAGDVYVVVQKVTGSNLVSVVGALVTLALFWELWFGITLYRRTQRDYAR